jgi:isopenicillin N synthase-like dioxygenase
MNVKVCNIRSNEFGTDFVESVTQTGFAVVTHHGIDHGLIKRAQITWREFFLRDQEYKDQYASQEDGNQGYKGMKSEKAVGAKVADLKEFYHWRPGKVLPPEQFVETSKLFSQLEDVGLQLLDHLKWRRCCDGSDNTILRTLYYPALKNCAVEPGSVRAAAHEDINFITLLVAATAPGLQVLDTKGKWHDVPHEENSIVVNIGDMLQLASRGLYRSTTHRVVNPTDSVSDRISMPLFMHPSSSTLLADGITAGQFLAQRIAEIYGHVKT